jgi:hypothetical protein
MNHDNYVDEAINKYRTAGWYVIRLSHAVNDFIANRDDKIHFVKVYGESELDSPSFHGIARNNFVQNAMSNGARPIFASVKKVKKWKVELTDKNENCSVKLRKKKT